MKKTFYLLVAVVLLSCQSVQYIPVSIDPVEKTFEVIGNKNDLYVRANNWMVETFKSSKSVIQFSDKEEGLVTGKYILKTFYSFDAYGQKFESGVLNAIIKIQVKDNASKITIMPDDFQEVHSSRNKDYRYTKVNAIEDANKLIVSYQDYLTNYSDDF